ncbi:type II toxin-antitoxin system PemK/MazF family toxin [Aquimarina macrocephali]|uniref:type II toxin-antitoxin system PemK/MazF family toxin n=1 Tax=Aquimarina macrocephali TaxID=666563 RepID=UPI0004BB28A0|nr:type II toxin-antitoxin system PemK/MazF family toxin [Aquimarina macrocephali]
MTFTTPPRITPRLRSAPKIREFFWCDFPEDAQLPEFWKSRPVVILSYRTQLSGAVTVIPCTSQDQHNNRWAFPIDTIFDGLGGWAICDKPTTVAVSRLSSHRDGVIRMNEEQFNEMLSLVLDWLPKPKLI